MNEQEFNKALKDILAKINGEDRSQSLDFVRDYVREGRSLMKTEMNKAEDTGDRVWETALRVAAFFIQDPFLELFDKHKVFAENWGRLIDFLAPDISQGPTMEDTPLSKALALAHQDKKNLKEYVRARKAAGQTPPPMQ